MALGTPVAAAAAYSGTGGGANSVTPAYPSGILATDEVLLFIGQKPATANGGGIGTLSGWTLRESLTQAGNYGTTLGADTGNTNLYCYSWDAPVEGQTGNLSVSLTNNNVAWAFIVRIPTDGGAVAVGSADGSRTTAPTSGTAYTVTLTNGTTAPNLQSGDLAIWAMCTPTDVLAGAGFSAHTITSTGTTFGTVTELNEPSSGTASDIGGYSAWVSATAGSSTAAPTIGATATGTVTNVRGPIVLVRLREVATQTLTPSLFTNTETIYDPTVTVGAVTLTPSLYSNAETFYTATVSPGAVTLTPSLYSDDDTFYTATLQAETPTQTLTPARFDNANNFFAATVTPGEVTLTPARYDNSGSFFAATASATYSLTADRYDNSQTFYSASVAQALAAARYDNTQSFYAPTVTAGPVTLTAARYDNSQTFFAADIPPPIRALVQRNFNRSNRVPNSTMQNAAVGIIGSGGLLPTTWAMGSFVGVTREVVALNNLPSGDPYIDIRVSGTNSTGSTQYPDLYIPATNTIPANDGMQVSGGLYIDLVAGSKSGFLQSNGTSLRIGEFAPSGTYVTESTSPTVTYGTRTTLTRTLTDARTGRVSLYISFAVANGATFDVTLRFSQPQLEYGPAATDYIPTYGTAVEVATVNTFYAPSVASNLAPARYDNTQTFYSATVTTGPVTLTPGLYSNTQTYYAPTVTRGAVTLQPARYDNAQTFYSASITVGGTLLQPSLYTNSNTFYAATVGRGPVTLTAGLFTNSNTFYAATQTNVRTLTASLFTNSNTFYAATQTNVRTLTPARYDNTSTFYSATVGRGTVTLQPGLYSNSSAFYAATVVPGPVTLTAARYNNSQSFYEPVVTQGFILAPTRYNNTQTFYAATITTSTSLSAGLFSNAQTFFAATVTPGPVTLAPARVNNAQAFYQPAIGLQIRPPRVDGVQAFYGSSVGFGLVAQDYVQSGYVEPGYVGFPYFNRNLFFGPTSQATYAILANRFDDADQIYVPKAFAYGLYQSPYLASVPAQEITAGVLPESGLVSISAAPVSVLVPSDGPSVSVGTS